MTKRRKSYDEHRGEVYRELRAQGLGIIEAIEQSQKEAYRRASAEEPDPVKDTEDE